MAPVMNHTNGVTQSSSVRILCIADVRGKLSLINSMAKKYNAQYVIHTGDFGFYDDESLDRMNEKTLKHVIQYSPLIPKNMGPQFASHNTVDALKASIRKHPDPILSELPLFLKKEAHFDVPVYTTWGACEDVRVLEKFRATEYQVDNLFVVDEHDSRLLEVGGLKLRLFGLGGAVVMHKLFDNGEGRTTIAGGQGTMWTTVLQMGELIETALTTFDRSETRIFISHMSPGREGLLAQLALALRADFTISAGLHFRYGTSYNDFSVNPNSDHFRNRLAASRSGFSDVWETVKPEVLPIVQPPQKKLIDNVLQIIEMASQTDKPVTDEVGFKNLWNFNLPDANFGSLILEVKDGQVSSEQRSEGFNFDYRRAERRAKPLVAQPTEAVAALPAISVPEQLAVPQPSADKKPVAPITLRSLESEHAPSAATQPEESPAVESAYVERPQRSHWGKPTASVWIGEPPDDVTGMFTSPYKEKIRDVRVNVARGSNQKYALVYFNNVDDAAAAIETLNHPNLRFGHSQEHSYGEGGRGGRGSGFGGRGSYSDRGGGSFDSRKSGGSDTEGGRGGFGRGGRGGRAAPRGGSSGSFSSRGSGGPGSPAPGRGRGRGGASSVTKDVSSTSAPEGDWPSAPSEGTDQKPSSTNEDVPVVATASPSTATTAAPNPEATTVGGESS